MKYYLYIEPYTYIFLNKKECLFYNTLDHRYHIIKKESPLFDLLEESQTKANKYCIQLMDKDLLSCEDLKTLRKLYMSDIIALREERIPPLLFYPGVKKDIYELENKNKNYLTELSIFLNTHCTLNCKHCKDGYKQFDFCTKTKSEKDQELEFQALKKLIFTHAQNISVINFFGGDLTKYSHLKELTNLLDDRNIHSRFYIHIKNASHTKLCLPQNSQIIVLIDSPDLKKEDFNEVSLMTKEIIAVVENESQLKQYEELFSSQKLHIRYAPWFTGKNHSFFKEFVFRDKEDILLKNHTEQDFIAKSVINENFFGKIYILATGELKFSLFAQTVGKINDNLHEIIHSELQSKNLWTYTRDQIPACKTCNYYLFCPSPGSHEFIMQEPLCTMAE